MINKMNQKEADIMAFEEKKNYYLEEGYIETVITVRKRMLLLLVSILALMIITFLIAYVFRYEIVWISGIDLLSSFSDEQCIALLKLIAALIISIPVHECLHALGWAVSQPSGFKSIRFGCNLMHLLPYCHCREAMSKKQYLLGSILPALLLGIIPYFVSFFSGSLYVLLFALTSIGGATCDIFTSLKLIRTKLKAGAILLDHPTEIGLHIYQK